MDQFLDKPTKPIDIILADANPIVLTAMSEILENDRRFSLVATSATAEGFLLRRFEFPCKLELLIGTSRPSVAQS